MSVIEDLDFSGRVCVVTGAAAGIGRATAVLLSALGADLALCDRDEEGLEELADDLDGAAPITGVLDVRDEAAVRGFLADCAVEHGRLDVLVNNAGGTYHAPFVASRPKGDEALVRENLLSVAWVIRAAASHLVLGGAVVNITSIEARRAAPGFALYAAAKAGVESLTRTLALELADREVRVNAVAPDAVATPGVGDLAGVDTPLGRIGRPEEVAEVVAFLASPLASFVTGAVVPVDGGNAAAQGWRRDAAGDWHL